MRITEDTLPLGVLSRCVLIQSQRVIVGDMMPFYADMLSRSRQLMMQMAQTYCQKQRENRREIWFVLAVAEIGGSRRTGSANVEASDGISSAHAYGKHRWITQRPRMYHSSFSLQVRGRVLVGPHPQAQLRSGAASPWEENGEMRSIVQSETLVREAPENFFLSPLREMSSMLLRKTANLCRNIAYK